MGEQLADPGGQCCGITVDRYAVAGHRGSELLDDLPEILDGLHGGTSLYQPVVDVRADTELKSIDISENRFDPFQNS